MKLLHCYAVFALVLFTSTGCAVKGRTPEGIVAGYGVKIARTVGAAQEAVGAIGKGSSVPEVRNGAVAALKGLEEVNQIGLKLSATLDRIAAARKLGENPDIHEALQLIDQIDAAVLLRVVPQLGDHPEVQAGLQAAREITKLILNIQLELGKV